MQGPAFGKGRIRRMLETRRARTTRKRPIEAYHWRLLIIGRFELADTVTNGSWQDEGGILQKGPVTSERGQYPLSNAIPWLGFLFEAMAAPSGSNTRQMRRYAPLAALAFVHKEQ